MVVHRQYNRAVHLQSDSELPKRQRQREQECPQHQAVKSNYVLCYLLPPQAPQSHHKHVQLRVR